MVSKLYNFINVYYKAYWERVNPYCTKQNFFMKIRLGISCESSARQMIHMKCQVLFSLEKQNKIKKIKL